MTLEEATNGLRERVAGKSGLDATVKFNFGSDGIIYLDGKSSPYAVSNEDKDADCTITISIDNYAKLASGKLSGTTAFMLGKLKLAGDRSIALKLSDILK